MRLICEKIVGNNHGDSNPSCANISDNDLGRLLVEWSHIRCRALPQYRLYQNQIQFYRGVVSSRSYSLRPFCTL